jgi:hypothetical protein
VKLFKEQWVFGYGNEYREATEAEVLAEAERIRESRQCAAVTHPADAMKELMGDALSAEAEARLRGAWDEVGKGDRAREYRSE